ncbi:MAG: hypothetical protein ACRDEA_11665, partial [Microcystaceae cyanobacterium]
TTGGLGVPSGVGWGPLWGTRGPLWGLGAKGQGGDPRISVCAAPPTGLAERSSALLWARR